MVNATFEALKDMQSPRHVAARRNKKVSDIVSGREEKEAEHCGRRCEGEEEDKSV